ncbi:MAG TPA: hemolysin III family protein [Desulfuromonadales bacterium]|nr:hemolysin III family protein [Desulfuromonadales bacterium]
MEQNRLTFYTEEEELANRLTHSVAALLSLVGLVILVSAAARTGDPYRIVSSAVFCSTLFLFYLISTIYHSLRSPRARYVFRVLDHVGIYLVIAGTYTPITLVSMREGSGWALFGTVWALALLGAVFKAFMTHRLAFLAPVFYIALGWLIVVDLEGLLNAVPPGGIFWLLAGGLSYTFGILFYAIDRIPYNHAIWHGFVIAGSFSHYLAILLYVVPVDLAMAT